MDVNTNALKIARSWIGTPYVHQHSQRGVGSDCLGLIRGVWRELYGVEPETLMPYTQDWSEVSGEERLWAAAKRHLSEIPIDLTKAGSVLLFRMKERSVAKHLGILANSNERFPTIVQAYSGHGVVETPLTAPWRRRIVAQYIFPDKE